MMSFIRTINKKSVFHLTTPIFYVNASPHIGHLYSAVITDCIFRYEKLRNRSTKYIMSTGTDEHGTKIQQAAAQHNQKPEQYCSTISDRYQKLFNVSNISYTHFNRTTDQEKHFPAVQHFWNALCAKDCIYKANYGGWYCVPDETFLTEHQLKESEKKEKVSIESGHPVQWIEENNYMFKLSKFQEDLIYWVKRSEPIFPKKFEKILLSDYLSEPLNDISVSRPASRVSWAIPVPNDDSQTVYVWLDALINYLTTTGYPASSFSESWPPSLHVVGQDILKFHAVYWPAFLIAAGMEPPKRLLVHSHWTVDGQKMSKSKGNVVDPHQAAEKFTYEGLRYFLLREGVAHSNGNYSDTKATRILNAEVVNTLGNLLARVCANVINTKQIVPAIDQNELNVLLKVDITKIVIDLVTELPLKCEQHFDSYNFYLVVDEVVRVLHNANNFMETFKPWELRQKSSQTAKLETVLKIIFETLRITGIILQPIIPDLSEKLLNKINVDKQHRSWDNLKLQLDDGIRNLSDGSAILFKRLK